MNRRALLAAGIAAVIGFLLLFMYRKRFEDEATGGRLIPVLYALQDIVVGEPLTRAKIGVRNIPERYIDERYVRSGDLRRVEGVRLSATVRGNQYLLWSDLSTSSESRRDLSMLVTPYSRAVTIRADPNSTFGGLIRPGDRVDVLVTLNRGASEGERVTVPLLQNLLVMAAGRDTGGEVTAAQQGTTRQSNSGPVQQETQVTLLAGIDEASLLVFAQDRGRLSLILRNPGDLVVSDTLRETGMDNLIEARGRAHAAPPPPPRGGSAPPTPPRPQEIR